MSLYGRGRGHEREGGGHRGKLVRTVAGVRVRERPLMTIQVCISRFFFFYRFLGNF